MSISNASISKKPYGDDTRPQGFVSEPYTVVRDGAADGLTPGMTEDRSYDENGNYYIKRTTPGLFDKRFWKYTFPHDLKQTASWVKSIFTN